MSALPSTINWLLKAILLEVRTFSRVDDRGARRFLVVHVRTLGQPVDTLDRMGRELSFHRQV